MADDAAALLRTLEVPAAHELALNHPDVVRSLVLVSTWARPDAYFATMVDHWHWLADVAPSERAMLEAFFLWIYTPRAHADGTVDQIIEEALAFAHPQSTEAFQSQPAGFRTHDTLDRLSDIVAPTLVLAGELDIAAPPRFGRLQRARRRVLARGREPGLVVDAAGDECITEGVGMT